MRELEAADWQAELNRPDLEPALFVHTPLCGTCALAKRMIAVVEAARPALRIASVDLNLAPALASLLRIESVPCLLLRDDRGEWSKTYRFGSVVELDALLAPLAQG
ncbi:thioredoxin family protein [Cohnella zeiphila]|uniref:Thioredoxin family protein n=1 Tax=Cohnella zeiphila TaxID=2761120 RepID=A0A7X0VUJ9_9BACL|nr:thioredoxin family protein [Cohnella zeiphila]MBB6730342.1 thioredoxin family protein [Cohnella zeiphila]